LATEKIIFLARGLGKRLRRYGLTAAAEAGFRRACLVIGPEHEAVRHYYTQVVQPRRLKIEFAIQEKPLGTADAVLAGRDFAGEDLFCVVNSDNYYPAAALKALADLNCPGLVAFDAEGLVREGNIVRERIAGFALVQISPTGRVVRIIEKPDSQQMSRLGQPLYVSMNCWCFSPKIFEACRAIEPSPRGELELTSAVQHAADRMGEHFAAVKVNMGVLDLSYRSDVAAVTARLEGVEVKL